MNWILYLLCLSPQVLRCNTRLTSTESHALTTAIKIFCEISEKVPEEVLQKCLFDRGYYRTVVHIRRYARLKLWLKIRFYGQLPASNLVLDITNALVVLLEKCRSCNTASLLKVTSTLCTSDFLSALRNTLVWCMENLSSDDTLIPRNLLSSSIMVVIELLVLSEKKVSDSVTYTHPEKESCLVRDALINGILDLNPIICQLLVESDVVLRLTILHLHLYYWSLPRSLEVLA
jgi:hypothetical protein